MFGYRPESINKTLFFDEANISILIAIYKYQNILLADDN